jgi:transcriptional regulator with XRE-family HTH domain
VSFERPDYPRLPDNAPICQKIAFVVRQKRRTNGWTQDQLAQKAHVSTNTLSQLERNPASLRMVSIAKVLHALDISFEDMFDISFPVDAAKKNMALQRFLSLAPRRI